MRTLIGLIALAGMAALVGSGCTAVKYTQKSNVDESFGAANAETVAALTDHLVKAKATPDQIAAVLNAAKSPGVAQSMEMRYRDSINKGHAFDFAEWLKNFARDANVNTGEEPEPDGP